MPTMNYDPWDVLLVPFPFTDRGIVKQRPAIVINKNDYQCKTGHLIMLMVTGAKKSSWDSDIKITDLGTAGLNIPSSIRFKMFSIDERMVVKKAGSLAKQDWQEVKKRLNQIII